MLEYAHWFSLSKAVDARVATPRVAVFLSLLPLWYAKIVPCALLPSTLSPKNVCMHLITDLQLLECFLV